MHRLRFFVLAACIMAQACTNTQDSASDDRDPGAGGTAGAGASTSAGTGGSSAGAGGSAGIAGSGGTGGANADAGGEASPDAGTTASGTPSIFKICGFTSSTMGETCDGLNAYIACVEDHCGSSLSQCFGTSYTADDFTGGTCADYATCATSASDPCSASCPASAECQQCLGDIVTCFEGSPCTLPLCTGGTGGGNDGGTSSDAGAPPIAGTCADLEACCASISDSGYRDACSGALADSLAASGDADCAVVYSTYRAAGICI